MRCVSTISRHPPSSSELGSAHLVVEQENVAVPMLQVRPPELFWNKTTCQKHLNIHTTLPALLLPGTIKKGSSKKPLSFWEYTLWLLSTYDFYPAPGQGSACRDCYQTCVPEKSVFSVLLSNFHLYLLWWRGEVWKPANLFPSTEPPQALCPSQNEEVPVVLCTPSLLSQVTLETGQLQCTPNGHRFDNIWTSEQRRRRRKD